MRSITNFSMEPLIKSLFRKEHSCQIKGKANRFMGMGLRAINR
ncbi:protein of unknown function [Vibrio tapetis subsp. tapetis]|uniref:Uncharacterized protein n=1 Tax=Vibrio tapetis subsp. tapetis TaxID=1671868 RepID=A0A2N8ZFK0_9VIBR|nr:protein of unknown function [Vibrio tapetis subsp. tapetis]